MCGLSGMGGFYLPSDGLLNNRIADVDLANHTNHSQRENGRGNYGAHYYIWNRRWQENLVRLLKNIE